MEECFDRYLSPEEMEVIRSLSSPSKIQAFLDSVPYSSQDANRSPVRVLREREAHCLDGGLFGAAALHHLGYPAVILDLLPAPGMDDDHVLALYKENGCWGCVAKSNFTALRSREPVYRSLRELVMSYFEGYFNIDGMLALRGYSRPLYLKRYDHKGWMGNDSVTDEIEDLLKHRAMIPVITPQMAERLPKRDDLTYRAGMLVVNKEGLFKPQYKKP